MADLDTYEVAYPDIKHPLMNKKQQVKERYLQSLRYYIDSFTEGGNLEKSMYRLDTLSRRLLDKFVEELPLLEEKEYRKAFGSINRTNFISPRVLSYIYLFLFDALFVAGIEDREVGNHLCEEINTMTKNRFWRSSKRMVEKMYNGDSTFAKKRIISSEMVKAWMDAREFLTSNETKITFTATMSAGKSTLINAIIGRELSFSKKAACTATVMQFLTAPCKTNKFCVSDGGDEIFLMSENEVRTFTNVRTSPCKIMGHFDSPLTTQRAVMIDTPGVNSCLNPIHKKITREELRTGTDILVYVIPVESYGSEDDYNHLHYIRKNVPYKKILFVVNMMDSCDFEDDNIEEILHDIKNHLSEIGFEEPVVCPMSAKAGLLIKKAMKGIELSDNDKLNCKTFIRKFTDERLQLEEYYPNWDKKNNESESPLRQAFVATGLPEFERLLYQYIREEQ